MEDLIEQYHRLFKYDADTGDLIRKITIGGKMKGEIAGRHFLQPNCDKDEKDPFRNHIRVRYKNKSLRAHRVIMEMHLGRMLTEDEQVIHVDNDGLNNRLENLKIVSTDEWKVMLKERKKSIIRKKKPRPLRIEVDIAYVPLTRGFEAIIDAEDAETVGSCTWNASPVNNNPNNMIASTTYHKRITSLHRFVLGVHDNNEYEVVVKDGNKLNCRKSNLIARKKADRTPWIDGDVAYIPLTQGQVAIIDAKNFDLVKDYIWMARKDLYTYYAARRGTKSDGELFRKDIMMHRIIANTPDDMMVDHVNRNGLDNREDNLRNCYASENQWNKKNQINNNSGYKGVHWYSKYNKWAAHIRVNGKRHFLGYFDCKHEAARVRKEAAEKYHGDYMRLE